MASILETLQSLLFGAPQPPANITGPEYIPSQYIQQPRTTGEIRQPSWKDWFANFPAQFLGVDYGNPSKTDMAMSIANAPLEPLLGILAGPGAYTLQRASPKFSKYLAKRPETFYAHFTDMPKQASAALENVGFTKPMDAQRAKELSFIHNFLAGLGQIPTVQNVKSGAITRGSAKNIYKPLPRDLKAGDVEIGLSPEYDPNKFRGRETPSGVMPGGKSKATLAAQRETAVHEGMHGTWLAKTEGQSGNPPLTEAQMDDVWKWIWESGVDPVAAFEARKSPMHLFLEAAARRAANARGRFAISPNLMNAVGN